MTGWVGGAAAASRSLVVPVPREQRARFQAGRSELGAPAPAQSPGATSASLPRSRLIDHPLLTYRRPPFGPTSQHRWFSHRYLLGVPGNTSRLEQLPVMACRHWLSSQGRGKSHLSLAEVPSVVVEHYWAARVLAGPL